MFNLKPTKGFTLIELMVVIAIIAVLSAIVLAMLGNARGKGNDAKVKAQISGIRPRAELYSTSNNNTYGIVVTADCTTVSSMFVDVNSGILLQLSGLPTGSNSTCYSSGAAYAVSATLPGAGGTNSWCVDSTGASKSRATIINSTTC